MDAMTVLQSRPILRIRPMPDGPDRSPLLPAAVAALCCAAAGILSAIAMAVAAWFASDTGSFGGAIRVGALGWLVAQGGGLVLSDVSVTVLPLGGCLLAGWLLYRGGRWVGATSRIDSLADVGRAAAVLATTYTVTVGVVYAATQTSHAHTLLVRTAVVAVVLSGGFGAFGVIRGGGIVDSLLDPIPDDVRSVLFGAVTGAVAMVGASGVLFTASMAVHFSDAVNVAEGLHAGLVGGSVLALVSLSAVPNAVLCSGAYLAGPGFMLGSATTVTTTGVTLGPLPALPILAATPRSGGAWWQEALVVVPVLAGAVSGVVTLRMQPVSGYVLGLLRGAAAGVLGGVTFGASTWLATGALGPGRMQEVGPDALLTTAVCGVALAVGGAASGAAWQWWISESAGEAPDSALVRE
jgi:hypothetical protein